MADLILEPFFVKGILARLTRSGIAHTATISRASLHYALLSGFVLLMLHHLLLAHVLFTFILHFRGFD